MMSISMIIMIRETLAERVGMAGEVFKMITGCGSFTGAKYPHRDAGKQLPRIDMKCFYV